MKGTIEVYSLNQKKRAIVQHYTGFDRPTTLVLVPSLGEMFVALESLDHFHIDRQSMKGGNEHHHVVEEGLSKKGPINLAVDEQNQVLYWSDGKNKKIEFSDFDGLNRKTFASFSKSPGELVVIQDNLFWTTVKSNVLQWRNKTGNGKTKLANLELPPGMQKSPDAMSITVGTPKTISSHPCMIKNGGCSDICVSDGPSSRVCLCETGHYFRDKTRTTCVRRVDCGFRCSTSGECLESSHRCNNVTDCLDKSDEVDCDSFHTMCSADQFKCANDECIPIGLRCDGNFNCADNSDETKCSEIEKQEHCRQGQIHCPSGFCLDVTQRCDGHDDCGDNFDEKPELCELPCPEDYFRCRSGQCMPKSLECNGFIDCKDASDEHDDCREFDKFRSPNSSI